MIELLKNNKPTTKSINGLALPNLCRYGALVRLPNILLTMSVLMFGGCTPLFMPLIGAEFEEISRTPDLEVAQVAKLGEIMVERHQRSITWAAELLEDHIVPSNPPNWSEGVISAGYMTPVGKSYEGHTVLFPSALELYDWFTKEPKALDPVFPNITIDGDELYDYLGRTIPKSKWKPIPWVHENLPRVRQRLIFNGTSGTNINLIYRETTNQDSFSQEFQVDLSETKFIEFKKVRIEVDEFSNTSVAYKVLSNFDDPKDYSFR